MAMAVPSAHAAELYSADGLTIRWDNNLRYSAGERLDAPNPVILSYPNSDDGDRDFGRGLMSNRLDLLSVLDVTGDSAGLQLSIEAWYDSVYQSHTDNNSPATYNPVSVPNTQFAHAVKNLDGQHADIGDSFVYGNFHLGDMPLSLRVGRQTLLWGESLFFSDNGIAAAQAPVDYIKSSSAPEGYSKDAFLPVNQVSLTLQPQPGLSLAAYYQLEWRASRLAWRRQPLFPATLTWPGAGAGACLSFPGPISAACRRIARHQPVVSSASRCAQASTSSISAFMCCATTPNIPSFRSIR